MFRLIAKIIYTVLLFIETVIALRFIFTLIQASRSSSFVDMIYNASNYFLNPFAGIGIPSQIILGGLIFDTFALLGLIIYMFIAFILVEMIRAFSD
jgi:hypothetical protein